MARHGAPTVAAVALAGLILGAVPQTAAADPGGPGVPRDKAPRARLDRTEIKKPQGRDKLGSHDRQLLARAEQKGTARVTILVATDKGATSEVARAVTAAGGYTATVNDRVGYVRASVPTGAVTRVAGDAKVLAVDLNESVPLPDPSVTGAGGGAVTAVSGPGPATPNDNPYLPTRDTGSVDFTAAHPEWDGRGVTIGILDSGVDLDHPALQTTSTGERKIVDWVTETDPVFDGDGTWRPMLTSVTASPTFAYAGTTWTAPKAGDYFVNRFSESITAGSEPAGDVNRDGDTTDKFGVLYDARTHDIWVDANQDAVFSADELMRPYREKHDVGHFGTDNPATAVVESMPFVVQYRENVDLSPYGGQYVGQKADYVNIGIVEDAHGSHVAGIAAGHSLFGGAMDGQAPGAKLVSARACTWGGGCTAAALADGMVDLVANRGVDVVNMSIGGLPALNDGNNARARLYDRLISEYGVQIVISAGNSGPGVNTVGDPSVATDAISVASSVTKETWLANYGSVVRAPLSLHNYSSRGPREDGGFKPDIMAPGSAVSTVPRWLDHPGVPETGYTLPIGYAMFNGTSMASPQAAGGAALLLSAGLATHTPITPRQLRDAIDTGADFERGIEAIAQGNGLMDVPAAWRILRGRPASVDYAVTAPVCTPISDFLATPGQGPGVYNRCDARHGGQRAGKTSTYKVTITRTSGASGRVPHRLRLVGDDGTFRLTRTSVDLPRGKPVTVTVKARTRVQGAHSAILQVDDPRTAVVDARVLVTVVLAEELAAPGFARSTSGSVDRNGTTKLFVDVPEGTKALQLNLSGIATKSQVRFIGFNPYGVPVESTSSLVCFTNFSDPRTCKPTSRSYADPMPGIWEFEVEARRTSPFLENPFRLVAAAQGVTVAPATQTIPAAPKGEASPVSWTLTNTFGEVTVQPEGGPLGSSVSARRTIANHDTQQFTVAVPEGASKFTATIGSPSDVGADLDLYVLDASGAVVGQSADGDSEESVTLLGPAAGTYTVQVDAYEVPSGSTDYDYLDVFFSPELGRLAVPATSTTLDRGASTTVTGQLTANADAAAGRRLFGQVQVLSSEGAVLGTGSVVVGTVTP